MTYFSQLCARSRWTAILACSCLFLFVGSASAQSPGDLIFTEVLQDASAVSDEDGEWFEIYNATDAPIDLQDWMLSEPENQDVKVISTVSLPIPARSYFIFAATDATFFNGNLPQVDAVFSDRVATYRLQDATNDGLEIRSPNGDLIDRIVWDNGTVYPVNKGAAMSFVGDVDAADAHLANDNPSNWNKAEIAYGDGDLGTPGQGLDEFEPSIEFSPSDVQGFGRTNLSNLPLPIQKDIDLQNVGGGTLSVLTAQITGEASSHFTFVMSPFERIDMTPGDKEGINIAFDTNLFETRTYSATLTITTNLPAPEDSLSVGLFAEVILSTNEAVAGAVVINEFSYDPRDGGVTNDYNGDGIASDTDANDEEFVELFNTLDRPIDISGWTLDDDSVANENTFVFPAGSVIEAGSYVVVFGDGTPTGFAVPTYVDLPNLGNGGDQVRLSDGFIEHDSVGFESGAIGTQNNLLFDSDGGVIARVLDGFSLFEARDPEDSTIGRTNDLSAPTPTVTPTMEATATPTATATETEAPTRSADFDGSGDVDANDLLILLGQWYDEEGGDK